MKDSVDDTVKAIKWCKTNALGDPSVPFSNDHDMGLYNGLELALSIIEERPVFYVDKDKNHSDYDVIVFPEYFL